MFYSGSRYLNAGTTAVTLPDGRQVVLTKIPLPKTRQLLGYHRRQDNHRLDHIAYNYLGDATAFWKLCEASETPSPDALGVRDLVGVPVKD